MFVLPFFFLCHFCTARPDLMGNLEVGIQKDCGSRTRDPGGEVLGGRGWGSAMREGERPWVGQEDGGSSWLELFSFLCTREGREEDRQMKGKGALSVIGTNGSRDSFAQAKEGQEEMGKPGGEDFNT